MSVTLREVARSASVSPTTVSRVVNQSPKVRIETRERVVSVIAHLGYLPNAYAANLRRARPEIERPDEREPASKGHCGSSLNVHALHRNHHQYKVRDLLQVSLMKCDDLKQQLDSLRKEIQTLSDLMEDARQCSGEAENVSSKA